MLELASFEALNRITEINISVWRKIQPWRPLGTKIFFQKSCTRFPYLLAICPNKSKETNQTATVTWLINYSRWEKMMLLALLFLISYVRSLHSFYFLALMVIECPCYTWSCYAVHHHPEPLDLFFRRPKSRLWLGADLFLWWLIWLEWCFFPILSFGLITVLPFSEALSGGARKVRAVSNSLRPQTKSRFWSCL